MFAAGVAGGMEVSSSWEPAHERGSPTDGGVGLLQATLAPPRCAEPPPPLELVLRPFAASEAALPALRLSCGARLAELRMQCMVDREPHYAGTLRGAPDDAGGTWRFCFELPAGCTLARVKLLSLAEKGVCPIKLEAAGATAAAAAAAAAGAAAGAGATAGTQPDGSGPLKKQTGDAPTLDGALLSQLDELRLLARHAAAGGLASSEVEGVPQLPPSLKLLQAKLTPGGGSADGRSSGRASAAQALAAAVARGVLIQQEQEQQQQQQPPARPPTQQHLDQEQQRPSRGGGAAAMPAGTAPDDGSFQPSAEAEWLAARLEASICAAVQAAEARLQGQLAGLSERMAALEARLEPF